MRYYIIMLAERPTIFNYFSVLFLLLLLQYFVARYGISFSDFFFFVYSSFFFAFFTIRLLSNFFLLKFMTWKHMVFIQIHVIIKKIQETHYIEIDFCSFLFSFYLRIHDPVRTEESKKKKKKKKIIGLHFIILRVFVLFLLSILCVYEI